MASKAVACEGDILAQPGAALPIGAGSGTWSPPDSISLSSYSKLTVGGVKVVHDAKGTFSFSGLYPDGTTPFTAKSTVSLKAKPTILQGSTTKVLRHGDSVKDAFGNILKVISQRRLASA